MFLPLLVVRLHTNVTVVLSVYMCTPNLFKCVKYSFRIFTLHVQFSLSIHMSPPILLVYVFQTKPHFSNLTHVLHFFFAASTLRRFIFLFFFQPVNQLTISRSELSSPLFFYRMKKYHTHFNCIYFFPFFNFDILHIYFELWKKGRTLLQTHSKYFRKLIYGNIQIYLILGLNLHKK